MVGLVPYASISYLTNLVVNLLPEVKNTVFAQSSSSSAQGTDAGAVEADLRRLKRMLERINATIYDAEERNVQDQSIKLWLKELRELGHEAGYVLEEYMYEVYRAQVEARNDTQLNPPKGNIDINGPYSVLIPYGMVERIRDIKNRFEEIAKDREALCLLEEDAPRRKIRRYTPTSPLVLEQSVFGRDEEKNKVINLLFLEEKGLSVLPIVGKGGIGKTTIAQLIYNDKRVQDYFDMVGWVHVSNNFNIARITYDIIESFTRTSPNLKSPSVLLEELASKIRGKRVFLVLDDMWNEERSQWELLRAPLILATKASVLVTTRNVSVASIMQTMEPLWLTYLSEDKCWLLFTHYAFKGIDLANQAELIEIGKKIIRKCRGLPLAVKLIGSLLSHEEELQSWMEILQSDLWELNIGNVMLAPLQISYERMPPYLKPCLLLCSMFPKGHEYSMNLVSRLWIAHGYIESKEKKSIEEVAADYTKMLYERSFFDDYNTEYYNYGLPLDVSFKLHDMVHDLAWLNSEKICCSVERGKQPFILKEALHLFLNITRKELPELLCSIDISFMQTLIMRIYSWNSIFGNGEYKNEISLNSLSKAENIRALHLEYVAEEVVPFSLGLGSQKHLRYLFLGRQLIGEISPESIFSCYNLRILILELSDSCVNLEGIGNLINLEFLQLFMSSLKLPESLSLLKKLRVLEIHREMRHKEYYTFFSNRENFQLPEYIGSLVELQKISITGFPLENVPKSLCKLTNLKELIFTNCILNELPTEFGKLTCLRFLFLLELHYRCWPLSFIKLIPSFTMNICNLVTRLDNNPGGLGWLKDFNDVKGALMIKDIRNITSIADAKNANLISKCNLETLSLLWNKIDYLKSIWHEKTNQQKGWEVDLLELQLPLDYSANKGIIGIEIISSKQCKSLKGQDLDILENFQPHPNLKHLDIGSYCGSEFPRWMGDPLSCASLVKLWIRSCSHIHSLPLGKVTSLKQLYIADCGKLLHLKRESLPPQLKHLTIHKCNSLVEVALLTSMVELEISTCNMLKSLSMIYLKMQETATESFEFPCGYCNFKPSEGLKSFPSLKKLTITKCPNLVIVVNQLVLAEDCEVHICYCNNLKDWCFQNNIKYDSDEGLKRIPVSRYSLFRYRQFEIRMFKEELRQQSSAFWNPGQNFDQNTASTANSASDTTLAALYQPPFALMFNGPFERAKMVAALQEKWLLVNVQSAEEFISQMLNRDIWANETLRQIIRSNFLFWQVYNTMSEGKMVCNIYKLVTLPAILVINPITGQKMRAWIGMVQLDRLLEDLLPCLDKGPEDHQAV